MKHAAHYEIILPYLKRVKNPHDRETPYGAPFLTLGWKSPIKWRQSVESMAYYFRREMHFDFPPYTATETDFSTDLHRDRVLVLYKTAILDDFVKVYYFIGAIGVRWREWTDAVPS